VHLMTTAAATAVRGAPGPNGSLDVQPTCQQQQQQQQRRREKPQEEEEGVRTQQEPERSGAKRQRIATAASRAMGEGNAQPRIAVAGNVAAYVSHARHSPSSSSA
jgi:hypothetical protein